MARYVKVAAAQMGPNNDGVREGEIVERMLALMDQAITEHVEILAYPEMALTTYFPKRIRDDYDQFFVKEIPPKALADLFLKARAAGMICHVGICEKDGDRRFNTAILTDETGTVCGQHRGRSGMLALAPRGRGARALHDPRMEAPGLGRI